jgi:hypothetical protein
MSSSTVATGMKGGVAGASEAAGVAASDDARISAGSGRSAQLVSVAITNPHTILLQINLDIVAAPAHSPE